MSNSLMQTYRQIDVENFVNFKSEESINLDFKRGDALKINDHVKKEISKDVSAFANSDGGIIIYGIEEKDHKAHDFVFVNGNEITKEWLENVINSRIHRRIEGIIIDPVRFNDKIEKTVYVVKIPRSLNAPHMTSEKLFYRRYNFQSILMEEYEIRNLYTRQDKTLLEILEPKFTCSPAALIRGKPTSFRIKIQFDIENKGSTIEKLYKLEIHIPKQVALGSNAYNNQPIYNFLVRHQGDFSIFSIPNSSPLFQNELATVDSIELKITPENFKFIEYYHILLKLYYSNGVDEKTFFVLDHATYKGSILHNGIFSGNPLSDDPL